MNKYLKEYNEFINQFEMVGSNVLFLSKDGYVETVSTGYASLENNILSHPNSIYRIASISKVIVAVGLLKLYEKGLVDLDEDVSKYLGFKVRNPKYEEQKITLRMILTQTSSIIDDGICDNGIYKGYDGSNCTDDFIKLEELLTKGSKHFYKGYSDHAPGSEFIYSNLGCGILACVCEKITNKYFPDYIIECLLNPLDIKSGFRLENISYPENLVGHYLYENNQFKLYRDYESFKKVQCLKYPLGENYRGVAGGLYISSIDLSKIMSMLMNKGIYNNIRILEEKTVKEMETVWWEGLPSDPTYRKKGLQMIILDQFTDLPLKGHFGNAYGLRSFMLYNDNGGIIFLCNGANFINDVEHMTILQEKVIKFLVEKTGI
jgi:CubicO group peptidase (beta-lactamase class C family)